MKKAVCLAVAIVFVGCASFAPERHPRKWTKDEKIALIHYFAGHSSDYYTTLRHQDYEDRIHEMNPVMGKYPSDRKITAYFAVTTGLILLVAHCYPKIRKPLLLNIGNLGISLSLRNADLIKEVKRQ